MGGFIIILGCFGMVFGLANDSILLMAGGLVSVISGYYILDKQSKGKTDEQSTEHTD